MVTCTVGTVDDKAKPCKVDVGNRQQMLSVHVCAFIQADEPSDLVADRPHFRGIALFYMRLNLVFDFVGKLEA